MPGAIDGGMQGRIPWHATIHVAYLHLYNKPQTLHLVHRAVLRGIPILQFVLSASEFPVRAFAFLAFIH